MPTKIISKLFIVTSIFLLLTVEAHTQNIHSSLFDPFGMNRFIIDQGTIRKGSTKPIADVFKVMELASGSRIDALWPKFNVSEIPVLVYDGLNTHLFYSREPLDGFDRIEKNPAVWIYKGQHPQVRGNSIIRIGGVWMATSVLSASSRRTGEKYDLKDMAGNERGSLRIMNHPCLTWFNDSFRVTGLMINGLKQGPEIIKGEKKLIIKENSISIEIHYSKLSIDKNRTIIDLYKK